MRWLACALTFVALLGASPAPLPRATPAHFALTSDDFTDDATLDTQFSYDKNGCTGENQTPKLAWVAAPRRARSFAIIVSDPDAYPSTFYHWVRVDIPASVTQLPPADDSVKNVGIDAKNSFGTTGYAGPCPPRREAPHHYVFTLYALSVAKLPKIGPKSNPNAVLRAMQRYVVDETQLTGRYGRG